MERPERVTKILESGLIAVIRSSRSDGLVQAAESLAAGGIEVLEFTLNTPDALRLIAEGRERLPKDVLVGAGTVLTAEDVRKAVGAGAEFIVMPGFDLEAVKAAQDLGVVVIPGAYTPTEVITAWRAGADFVKLFPASQGGPAYLRALLGPLPEVRLVPTGGVSVENAAEYIRAGAAAVGVGGKLVDRDALRDGDYRRLEAAASQLIDVVAKARMERIS